MKEISIKCCNKKHKNLTFDTGAYEGFYDERPQGGDITQAWT